MRLVGDQVLSGLQAHARYKAAHYVVPREYQVVSKFRISDLQCVQVKLSD